MIKRILLIVFSVVIIIGAIRLFKEETMPPLNGNSNILSVTVISPQQKSFTEKLSVTGMTIAREEVQIVTELANVRVNEVYVDVGDRVEKGQKLALLNSESLGNQLEQLEADYEYAADEFARFDAIKDTGAVSIQAVTEKRTTMRAAKARLDDARLNVKRSIITAPKAGIIVERHASLGALVSTDQPLYRIAEYGEIEVEMNVPEASLSMVTKGERASVEISGIHQKIEGKVRLVSPRVDQSNRTALVRIALEIENNIAVGLFATAHINIREVSGLALPATSILSDSEGEFVWQVNAENKVLRLAVTVVERTDHDVVVTDIPADSVVIARAGTFIKEGEQVHIVDGTNE
ncbi:MAG: efflux RND transporter periplasmic adaptor subunit [Pseudomonadales bacterium]|nr:efflux RND transporter periplasmic adaptor subunit [Pseudomonadales bacterium]